MVGCDEELIQLMDLLTRQQSSQQIVLIAGMGGIGKTTLAKNTYENLLIVHRFDIRLWITVSQTYSLRKILLEILSCQNKSDSGIDKKADHELGEQLYKSLYGRRYLIVLDDMWSIEAWDEIMKFVPKNNNGSQIVVTTRESNLAIQFGSTFLSKKFLDEDASWELFCEKAFPGEYCPSEFEAIGRKIVEKCKGLPLLVSVTGGLLGKSNMTQEYWENIANDINSVLNSGEDERCLNILSLSYRRLPTHLRPCLLYMGIFPEDHEIRVSQLIKLWVAEGFLKPNETRSSEEVAEGHLAELVDRNLILVRRLGSTGKIKTCSIHDVIRDLCLRVAEKDKFLCVMRSHDIPQGTDMVRRIVCHERIGNRVFNDLQSATPLARSLLCRVNRTLSSGFRLLRVWTVIGGNESCSETHFPDFQHINLRYLAASSTDHTLWFPYKLHSSVSTLWNVQTLILTTSSRIYASSEIWGMTQIRHLVLGEFYLPDPPSHLADQQDGCCIILRNLQTLETVINFKLTVEVCKIIPNLKKLKLLYFRDFPASNYHSNLTLLRKLESLSLFSYSKLNLKFPDSLKKLTLENCQFQWEDLTMIGSLPHLEILELQWDSVYGPEWNPVEGEFLRLKYLSITGRTSGLIRWNADKLHFPILKNLIIRLAPDQFDGIPLGIGEIPTLEIIDVIDCNERVGMSAVRILEEQERFGNESLQVRIEFLNEKGRESFKEKTEQELNGFTSTNLQITKSAFGA